MLCYCPLEKVIHFYCKEMHFSTNVQVLLLMCYFIPTTHASSIVIKCAYGLKLWSWSIPSIGTIYECECKESINAIERNTNVSNITGKHSPTRDRFSVEGIHIIGASYLPKGIERFFPNLVGLRVEQHLKDITQSDLKAFPKLKHLSLDHNRLEVIEKDLFRYNQDLTHISLKHNFIQQIDSNVFDRLGKVTTLELDFNDCVSDDADDRDAVLQLIKQTKIRCNAGELTSTSPSTSEIEKLIEEKLILNHERLVWKYLTMGLLALVVLLAVSVLIIIKKHRDHMGSEPNIRYIHGNKLVHTSNDNL